MNADTQALPSAALQRPRRGKRLEAGKMGLYVFLATATLFFSVPLIVILMTALKPMDEIRAGSMFLLPAAPQLGAFAKAWSSACTGLTCEGVSVGFWNSLRIVIPSALLAVFFGAMNGYALALWRVRGAGLILGALTAAIFIPYQVILYPLVKLWSAMGLFGSVPGLIAVHVIFNLPLATLIFRNFYVGVPEELVKAARVDGAGFFRIFFSVLLPLSGATVVVCLILLFTGMWNDYLFGLIFAGQGNAPMTVQLSNIVRTTAGDREYNVDMAATLLTALPPLLVYFCSGRYFVRGITAGAVKG